MKILYATIAAAIAQAACLCAAQKQTARPTSDDFKKSAVYQILIPSFTQEGTIKKAEEMLPYIKSLGFDIVYLCPIFEQDDDTDKKFWSERQKSSKTENPKNPYRIKNHFKIEPNYGTPADAKSFVETAHKLGLKVLFDLVYYHCGPKADIIKENPDSVIRNEDGSVKIGEWRFPRLNFKNAKLREYLISNMEYLLKTYNIDGFRTDVGSMVPSDFWVEAYAKIKRSKPDLLMIEESERASALLDVYDSVYEVGWQRLIIEVFHEKKSAELLRKRWEKTHAETPEGGRVIRAMENHDFANGPFRPRCEIRFGFRGMDAVQVLNFTMDGIPFIYSGNEFADDSPMTIFSDRTHGRYFVGWENIYSESGMRRLGLVKSLIALRRENSALYEGETRWLASDKPNEILAYTRNSKDKNVFVAINASDRPISVKIDFSEKLEKEFLSYGVQYKAADGKLIVKMEPKGYIVAGY